MASPKSPSPDGPSTPPPSSTTTTHGILSCQTSLVTSSASAIYCDKVNRQIKSPSFFPPTTPGPASLHPTSPSQERCKNSSPHSSCPPSSALAITLTTSTPKPLTP